MGEEYRMLLLKVCCALIVAQTKTLSSEDIDNLLNGISRLLAETRVEDDNGAE